MSTDAGRGSIAQRIASLHQTIVPQKLGQFNPVIDLSIVIVNWNTRSLLHDCLASLRTASETLSIEVVVVDNASHDGSDAMVRAEFPEVHLYTLATNVGFATACNRGLAEAGGRYLLLLNSDTVVLQGALSRMVAYMDSHAQVGVLGPRLLNADGTLQSSAREFPRLLNDIQTVLEVERWPLVGPWRVRHLQRTEVSWTDHRQTRPVDWVTGACLALRRTALEEVGLLDPAYFFFAEEIDLCYRMHRHGWSVVLLAEAEIIHLGGQSSARIPAARLVWKYRSLLQFYRRHRRSSSQLLLRLAIALSAALHLSFLVVRHRGNPEFRRLLQAYLKVLALALYQRIP